MNKILSVVVATREISNIETGLDLLVYEQQSVQSTRTIRTNYYSLTIVSSLPCFKDFVGTKSADVIQYTMQKTYEEFAQLHKSLCDNFLAARIPDMPSKPISLIDTAAKSKLRQKALDKFVKYCASKKKIARSKELLEFLGVSNENVDKEKNEEESDKEEEKLNKSAVVDSTPDKNAPSEPLEDEVELFKPVIKATELTFEEYEETEDDPNLTQIKTKRTDVPSVKLFGDTDIYGGGVKVTEQDLVILPAATPATEGSVYNENEESDISDIEDDEIEKLVRRLEKSKETREARGNQAGDAKKTGKQADITVDPSEKVVEIENFDVDDISKYIQENAVNLDDTDLGL